MSHNNKPPSSCFIPASLDDARLSLAAFRVYCHLARRRNAKGQAFPSVKDFVTTCRANQKTIIRAIRELEQRGLVAATRRWGTRSEYTLTGISPEDMLTMAQNGLVPEIAQYLKSHEPLPKRDGTSVKEVTKGTPYRYSNKVSRRKSVPTTNSLADSVSPTPRRNRKPLPRPSLSEIIEYCAERNLPKSDAEYLDDLWTATGYTNGKKPILDWKAQIRSRQAAGYLPSQKLATQAKPRPNDSRI